jgi:HEAT repeat protein
MAKDQAVKPLLEIILSEDFYKRDYDEKVSFFRALGETGSEEAIPILKKIAKKRKWFKKGKWDEMRLCAANVLKVMEGGPRQGAQR